MRTKPGEISPKLRAVFLAICTYKMEHDGQAPSRRQILQLVGLRSISTVTWYLHRLEKVGLIKVDEMDARGIQVIGGSWEPPQAYEVLGKQAGEELKAKAEAELAARADKIVGLSLGGLAQDAARAMKVAETAIHQFATVARADAPRYPQIAAIGKLVKDDGRH